MPFQGSAGHVDAVALSYGSSSAMAPLSPSISRRYSGATAVTGSAGPASAVPKFSSYRSNASYERPAYRTSALSDYNKSSYNLTRLPTTTYSELPHRYTANSGRGSSSSTSSSLSPSYDLSKYLPQNYVPNIQRSSPVSSASASISSLLGGPGSSGASSTSSSGSSGRSSDLLGGDELSSERRAREPSVASSSGSSGAGGLHWTKAARASSVSRADEVLASATDQRNNNHQRGGRAPLGGARQPASGPLADNNNGALGGGGGGGGGSAPCRQPAERRRADAVDGRPTDGDRARDGLELGSALPAPLKASARAALAKRQQPAAVGARCAAAATAAASSAQSHSSSSGAGTATATATITTAASTSSTTSVIISTNSSSATNSSSVTSSGSSGSAGEPRTPRANTPSANNTELLTTNNNANKPRYRDATSPSSNSSSGGSGGASRSASGSPVLGERLVVSQPADRTLNGEAALPQPSHNGLAQPSHNNQHPGASSSSTIECSSSLGKAARSRAAGSRDERCGLNGLRNIGNTCFMNSVIQCLSNTRPLLEYLLNEQYLADINTTTSSMKGALIKSFSQVIQELWENDGDHVVNTSSFKSQIQRFAPRFMGYSQQDAQEFLRYLLEGLHEDVNRVTVKPQPIHTDIPDTYSDSQKAAESWKRYLRSEDSTIVDVFVGQLRSSLRCTVCDHVSVTLDPFWDLSLPIPTRSGTVKLSQCLEHFTKDEVMDGDEKPTCSKCQMRRKCTKSFSIQKFPKILVIHLKRFSPMERFRGKLNVLVDFPLTGLDLSACAAPRVQGCTYNLYGVANHSGTTHSGHYTAYCKHPYSAKWHEYNDSRVSSVSSHSVVSCEGYVLFYEQQPHSSHL